MLEVCVDSFESVQAAIDGGASRIELCSALSEGGLTPTCGLMKAAKKYAKTVPIFAMLRPRRGMDFQYSEEEMNIIVDDLEYLRNAGADGFVFGALNDRNEVDIEKCRQVLRTAKELPVTFHRAFDLTDPNRLLENGKLIRELGFRRILTSGLEKTAEAGSENIAKIAEQFSDTDFKIMPGAGITSKNLLKLVEATGCVEYHASARSIKQFLNCKEHISMGGPDNDTVMVADRLLVNELVQILKTNCI